MVDGESCWSWVFAAKLRFWWGAVVHEVEAQCEHGADITGLCGIGCMKSEDYLFICFTMVTF